jgi:hypothetical protein
MLHNSHNVRIKLAGGKLGVTTSVSPRKQQRDKDHLDASPISSPSHRAPSHLADTPVPFVSRLSSPQARQPVARKSPVKSPTVPFMRPHPQDMYSANMSNIRRAANTPQ